MLKLVVVYEGGANTHAARRRGASPVTFGSASQMRNSACARSRVGVCRLPALSREVQPESSMPCVLAKPSGPG
eukprot:6214523-Pleurochrysis_carterae.AAC.1